MPDHGKMDINFQKILDDPLIPKIPVSLLFLNENRDPFSSISEIPHHQVLGRGSSGAVYKLFLEESQGSGKLIAVALKVLHCAESTDLDEFYNEIKLLSSLKHPHVVSFFGVCLLDSETISLVTEFSPLGSLDRLLSNPEFFENISLLHRIRMALDIAEAMAFLHSCQPVVLHRDIKSSNILLDSSLRAKIADLGISTLKPTKESARSMTVKIGMFFFLLLTFLLSYCF